MARLAATLCLLMTASLVAGCASAPAEPSAPEAAADPGRMSVSPQGDAPMGPIKVVALSSHEVVGTPGIDHVFGVTVPQDALAVRATLSFRPGLVEDLRMELDGCELLATSYAMAGSGTVILGGECRAIDAGLQQATLAFTAGTFVGTLEFKAVLPA